jgi:two-component system NtrC family sensor kinase
MPLPLSRLAFQDLEPERTFTAEQKATVESLSLPAWLYCPHLPSPIAWANEAGLRLWRSEGIEELSSRPFDGDTGAAVRWVNAHRTELLSAEGFTTPWTIYPHGEPIDLTLLMRAVRLEDGTVGVLVEARENQDRLDPDAVRIHRANAYLGAPLAMFDAEGSCLAENVGSRECYGDTSQISDRFVDTQALEDLLDRARATNTLCRADLAVRSLDGQRWHAVEVQRARDPVTGGDAIVVSESSIDELRRVQQELTQKNDALEQALSDLRAAQTQLVLRQQMAALGELVAGVAHELNTPVGALVSASDTSRKVVARLAGSDDPKAQARLIGVLTENQEVVHTAGHRVAEIVRALQRFVRLDEAERQRTQLNEEIAGTLDLLGPRLQAWDVETDEGELPQLECDPRRLNQAFLNILVNACQAIEARAAESGGDYRGRIRVSTRLKGTDIVVDFTDNGSGIAPDDIGRVFDPGFTTRGVKVGTGLGLSICYNIVEEHGGRIEAHSDGLGHGATLRVFLPTVSA